MFKGLNLIGLQPNVQIEDAFTPETGTGVVKTVTTSGIRQSNLFLYVAIAFAVIVMVVIIVILYRKFYVPTDKDLEKDKDKDKDKDKGKDLNSDDVTLELKKALFEFDSELDDDNELCDLPNPKLPTIVLDREPVCETEPVCLTEPMCETETLLDKELTDNPVSMSEIELYDSPLF